MAVGEVNNSTPKVARFRALADQIRQEITNGRWHVGGRLPTEQELARTHAVSLNTVRRAISVLATENLVVRRQGSGTYVTAIPGGGRPRFIGVLVPSNTYYYPRVIEGIERATSAGSVKLVLACSEYDPELEFVQLQRLVEAGVAGIIVVPNLHLSPDPVAHLERLTDLPVPYVLAERRPVDPAPDDSTAFVCTNFVGGGYLAVRHLHGLGRRRVGYLGRSGTATSEQVYAGFREAIDDLGVAPPQSALVRRPEWSGDDLADYARICVDEGLDAVFCLGDREATGVLNHVRRLGARVPEDVAIVAYDDEVAELADIPLTAVSPPKSEIGRLAAETLLRRIELGPSAPINQIVLQPRIAVRASCGAPPELSWTVRSVAAHS
ncbi:GntR family transcriptional regulator [Phytoactinopolyspora halotolerans]|uniref:Substrate-binding domain-containing protein n=1 Tax=Phytoactinopolyspora halotolerans TaxID=1981512 RepID=A0A6L9SCD2_9ACTN|nr:GntR family transcriptional regulator [Phytoactinopolyspora halotolerans]NEE02737.1 substrate-binding domain-containing protein [Phytoactinopolyspora halotolerans]